MSRSSENDRLAGDLAPSESLEEVGDQLWDRPRDIVRSLFRLSFSIQGIISALGCPAHLEVFEPRLEEQLGMSRTTLRQGTRTLGMPVRGDISLSKRIVTDLEMA